jgi:7-cyano-7-deazaguanine synthase
MMNLDRNACMVVLSGGQDSTICLGLALHKFETVHAVSFDYGQRHKIELHAASRVVRFYAEKLNRRIKHETVELGRFALAGTSPLTDLSKTLETYQDHDEMEKVIGDRVEKTFVPMRNAVFLTLAANRAVVAGCANLVTGVCQEDNANYPDCRQVFINSMEAVINQALGIERDPDNNIAIWTPLMRLSKAESIHLAITVPHAYEALRWSHTAYDGRYPPTGKDHASVLRAHGFEQANVPDPLVVRAWQEGLMELPTTPNYMGLEK